MNSFKQKLKSILNDSSSLKDMSNIEQKFEQYLLKTYKKIKRDNIRQSIMVSYYSTNERKTTRNIFKRNTSLSGNKRGISPKTAHRMVQTFSLMKNTNSNSFYNKNNYDTFYNALNRYLSNSSKIQKKIQRDIDYITKENYKSKIKVSGINRSKSLFNNNTINLNNHTSKNKTINSMKKMFESTFDGCSKEREKDIGRTNIRIGKIDFGECFNQFKNRQKYNNFNF